MIRISLAAAAAAALLVFAAPAFAAPLIFVSNEKDNTVTVLNADTLEIVKTIKVARRPRGIVVSPDGKEAFVAAGDGDIMDVIDTNTLEVSRHLEFGPRSRADGDRSQGQTSSTSPTRTTVSSPSWTSRAATSSPRFRWASSPRAWA